MTSKNNGYYVHDNLLKRSDQVDKYKRIICDTVCDS